MSSVGGQGDSDSKIVDVGDNKRSGDIQMKRGKKYNE